MSTEDEINAIAHRAAELLNERANQSITLGLGASRTKAECKAAAAQHGYWSPQAREARLERRQDQQADWEIGNGWACY